MKRIYIFALLLFSAANTFAQNEVQKPRFYSDFLMGPYLFVDHIPYDAVMLFGSRLGYEVAPGFAVAAEYVVGQQNDEFHTLGMTHHASVNISWFMVDPGKKFRPYLICGSGFLEFKSFTKDKYGIGSYIGLGTETNFSKSVHGFIEPRYLNIGQMDLGGVHELSVFWGLRLDI